MDATNKSLISTMTAIASIGTEIDIQKIKLYIQQKDLSYEQNVKNNNTNIGVIRHPLPKNTAKTQIKEFKNQVQLHIPLMGNNGKTRQIKIKVFNNGRLHITGLQSIDMIKSVLSYVNKFLCDSSVLEVPFNEEIANANIEIVMINMTIDAGYKINQKVFRDLLIKKYNIYAEFAPKTYAGINALFEIDGNKQASFLIFQSGKINIAGARGWLYLHTAKECIQNIIQNERSFIELHP